MEMWTAKVVGGQLDIPEGAIPEGARVIVLVPGDEEPFTLTEAEKAELTEAMEQIRRGEWIDGWELLRELKSSR